MIVECTLKKEQLAKIPTPVHLATTLLMNGGFFFGDVREGKTEENKVYVWNMDELIGIIEYQQLDLFVNIRVTDAPKQTVLTDEMLYIAQSLNTILFIK